MHARHDILGTIHYSDGVAAAAALAEEVALVLAGAEVGCLGGVLALALALALVEVFADGAAPPDP